MSAGDLYVTRPPSPRRRRLVPLRSAAIAVVVAFALGASAGILFTKHELEPLLEERAEQIRYDRVASGACVAPDWVDPATEGD